MKKYLLLILTCAPFMMMAQNTWLAKSNFTGIARTAAVAFSIGGKGYLGTGTDFNGTSYNDFWEYDPVPDTWTQVASLPAVGRFRAFGLANATKGYVGTGQTNFLFDDFYEYDPLTNTWTPKSNVGTMTRCSSAGFIIGDKIYVGTGYTLSFVMSKDFWEYDILTDTWTQMADFGGVEKAFMVGFAIGTSGYLGTGNDAVGFGTGTKDFWEYVPATNTWSQKNYFPGTERAEAFGFSIGNYGYIGTGTQTWGSGAMSDLWKYDPSTDSWLVMAPFPGGIREHAACMVIGCKAYVGTGFSNDNSVTIMSDWWEYTPDHTCSVVAAFSADNHVCPGTCINFTNLSSNSTSYIWSFPGANPSVSADEYPTNICYNFPGSYDVTLIATNSNQSDTLTLINYITVYPQPPPQGIMQSGDTLFANQGATAYQWFYNGNIINGATNYFYVATQSGDYNVVATDENSCEVEAVINNVLARLTPALSKGEGVSVFPNPVIDNLTIYGEQISNGTDIEITIYNVLGEKIYSAVNLQLLTVDCRMLASGMYYLQISRQNKIITTKFVKSAY
jgi:N-acetylneuraminic acid mutarotase